MPLSFIKKLAGKLLGKSTQPKTSAAKSAHAKKGTGAHAGRTGAAASARVSGEAKPSSSDERSRGPRRERPAGERGPRPAGEGRDSRGPRRDDRRDGRRDDRRDDRRNGRRDDRRTEPRHEGEASAAPAAASASAAAPAAPAAAPAAAGTGRPMARPPSRQRHERGSGEERPVSNPHARRPGGAVGDEEQAKRRTEHATWTPDMYQVEPAEGKKRFQDFDLPTELLHAVADMGFKYCTPIQTLSLEYALAGKNVTGKAQTGTGKTAAFLVAILTRYLRSPEARQEQGGAPRALVIAPTRELVIQICKDAAALGKYCGLRSLAVYGGMDYERQKREVMDAPVDLLVATPGRLLDFVRSRVIDLSKVDTLVIDEADRMLDMGFIPDVRSIINRLPPKEKRGTMLYSATLSDDVMRLASQWMEAPVRVEVEGEQVTTKTIKQIVYVVTAREKFTVLYNQIQQYPDSRMLIFCNRKNTTEDVAFSLERRGIRCEMLSGDVNQNRRLRVLEDFREGKVRIVVATDVAGRGLHVDDIGFVINFDFPYEPEDYVHRIGRTGRAGASGTAISFADEDESFIIPEIEKFIGEELKCTVLQHDDPLLTKMPEAPRAPRPHRERGEHAEQHERGPRPESAPRAAQPIVEQVHGELLPPEQPAAAEAAAPSAVEPAAVVPPAESERPREAKPATRPPAPAAEHRERAEAERPRETRAPVRTPAPQPAPAQNPATPAARKPRFSDEWVPGQSGK
jgi:ATP-dependent RNA helicase RhlB